LTGDSILYSPSNENWSIRRKSLTAAFYKDKLIKMIEIMKKITHEKVKSLRERMNS
jgi:cytochrome P450